MDSEEIRQNLSLQIDDFKRDLNEEEDDVFDAEIESESQDKNLHKLDQTEPALSYLRYFQFNRGDPKDRCRICTKQISRNNGSTSGMDKHLKLHARYYINLKIFIFIN